ncbi:MAG TPA: hypothetical protein VHA07_13005 [Devosia sp.]|nr:hypothetical protein [Devosia sp.]
MTPTTTPTRNPLRPAGTALLPAGVLLMAALLALAGCNTAAGFGRDIRNTGNFIEKKADQALN